MENTKNDRPIKELLQLMLDNFDLMHYGLCGLCSRLSGRNIINYGEWERLENYLYNHTPSYTYDGSDYWWKPGLKTPRKKWLKEQIKLCK